MADNLDKSNEALSDKELLDREADRKYQKLFSRAHDMKDSERWPLTIHRPCLRLSATRCSRKSSRSAICRAPSSPSTAP